jgi:hypothetical protein
MEGSGGGICGAVALAFAFCVLPALAHGRGAPVAETQCTGADSPVSVLRDDFDGTQIDAAVWAVDPNAGSVTVAGGEVRVVSPASTSFPLVTSVLPVIPQTGGFSVRWVGAYEQSTLHGTCSLAGSRGLPTDGGPNTSVGAFASCQDALVGFNVQASTSSTQTVLAHTMPAGSLLVHEIEYCWLESRVEVWVDGVRRFDAARDPSLPAPDSLWFGNYARGGVDTPWSNFSLDVVEVTAFEVGGRIFADGYEPMP